MDKKQKRLLRWHRWVWNHVDVLLLLVARLRYKDYVCEEAPKLEGGYLVLPNHVTGFDQFFVAFSFLKRHMYYMVSEHTFRRKFIGFVMKWLTGPISRVKGSADAGAVLAVLRWLRRGVPVCIFPEGVRNWDGVTAPIHPATAKLVKSANVPVMTYRIRGGYLSEPRWGRGTRQGPIRCGVVGVYYPEQLKAMSLKEIEELLVRDLYVDAYADQEASPSAYLGRRRTNGLEEALYLCPKCGGVDSLRGRGDVFSCSCGARYEMDAYGFFPQDAPYRSVRDWDAWQTSQLRARAETGTLLFRDGGGDLRLLEEGHRTKRISRGETRLDAEGLRVGDVLLRLKGMGPPSLCHYTGGESMMVAYEGKTYELRLPKAVSCRKYSIGIEQMQELAAAAAAV